MTLFGNKVFADNSGKNSDEIVDTVGPKPNESVLRDRKEQAETQRKRPRKDGGRDWSQECPESPEARRGKKDPSIEASEGA